MENNAIQFKIQFISCSVDPNGGFNPPDMEHVNIYKYTSVYKFSIVGKKCHIITRFNILS